MTDTPPRVKGLLRADLPVLVFVGLAVMAAIQTHGAINAVCGGAAVLVYTAWYARAWRRL